MSKQRAGLDDGNFPAEVGELASDRLAWTPFVYTPEPASPSAEALGLLASWGVSSPVREA